ncbi:MAG: hypothetical protein M9921_04820 [Fimbriimonadaceae bacterium]|nr:hypothetical protein [Chthonomonadaceae bacterium]MCO5296160.1 hypothetical protein [Fimbriimonadaceae bacterium]
MLAIVAAVALGGPLLTVSTAVADLTPPEPLPLGGYTERADKLLEPGGEPLAARVIVWKQGAMRVAMVSADMLTIPESLAREVRGKIPGDVKLFLVATHTHSAPDSQMLNDRMTFKIPGIANYKRRWLDWYAERIASGVRQALASSGTPAAAVDVWERHVEANRPRRAGGWSDSMLTLVGGTGGKGMPRWFAHYAAHAVVYGADNLQTHPDFPTPLLRRLGAFAFFPGAIGDVSPRADGPDAPQRMADFLSRFQGGEPVPRVVAQGEDPLVWTSEPIALDAPAPHPDFAKAYGVPDAIAQLVVKQFAPKEAEVRAFRIGKLAIVGIPGEPTGAVGRSIRDAGRRFGFDPVLVVSHVDGWIGYILEPDDYRRGGYEATLSFNGPDTGTRVEAASERALRRLARSGLSLRRP